VLAVCCAAATQAASAQPARRRVGTATRPATGNTEDQAARARFEAGLVFYEAGRFEEALAEFDASWRLSQRPEMLLNIANAAERALLFQRAIDALEEYLRRVPAAEDRETVERRIERDRVTARELEARTASAGQGTRDAEPRTADGSGPASAGSGSAERTTDAPDGGDVAPERRPDSGVGHGGAARTAGWITLGGAAALAVGAAVTGIVSHGTYGDLEAACPGGVCPPDRQGDIDDGRAMAVTSTVLTGLAVVAAGVGLALVIVGGGGDDADRASAARVEVTPGLAGATVRVRF
jgi:hypothetical protein